MVNCRAPTRLRSAPSGLVRVVRGEIVEDLPGLLIRQGSAEAIAHFLDRLAPCGAVHRGCVGRNVVEAVTDGAAPLRQVAPRRLLEPQRLLARAGGERCGRQHQARGREAALHATSRLTACTMLS